MKLPADPRAKEKAPEASSGGAFLKAAPAIERRDPNLKGYTGPERRRAPVSPKLILGRPRWLVFTAAAYFALLAIAMILIFTY